MQLSSYGNRGLSALRKPILFAGMATMYPWRDGKNYVQLFPLSRMPDLGLFWIFSQPSGIDFPGPQRTAWGRECFIQLWIPFSDYETVMKYPAENIKPWKCGIRWKEKRSEVERWSGLSSQHSDEVTQGQCLEKKQQGTEIWNLRTRDQNNYWIQSVLIERCQVIINVT